MQQRGAVLLLSLDVDGHAGPGDGAQAGTGDRDDDTVAPYSSRGTTQGVEKPDVVAPGSHLVSLRAPGSEVDDENPGSRIGSAYFRGTGTSMSTALVSGVAADLLSARPTLIPDQVKALLVGTAYRNAGLSDPAARSNTTRSWSRT